MIQIKALTRKVQLISRKYKDSVRILIVIILTFTCFIYREVLICTSKPGANTKKVISVKYESNQINVSTTKKVTFSLLRTLFNNRIKKRKNYTRDELIPTPFFIKEHHYAMILSTDAPLASSGRILVSKGTTNTVTGEPVFNIPIRSQFVHFSKIPVPQRGYSTTEQSDAEHSDAGFTENAMNSLSLSHSVLGEVSQTNHVEQSIQQIEETFMKPYLMSFDKLMTIQISSILSYPNPDKKTIVDLALLSALYTTGITEVAALSYYLRKQPNNNVSGVAISRNAIVAAFDELETMKNLTHEQLLDVVYNLGLQSLNDLALFFPKPPIDLYEPDDESTLDIIPSDGIDPTLCTLKNYELLDDDCKNQIKLKCDEIWPDKVIKGVKSKYKYPIVVLEVGGSRILATASADRLTRLIIHCQPGHDAQDNFLNNKLSALGIAYRNTCIESGIPLEQAIEHNKYSFFDHSMLINKGNIYKFVKDVDGLTELYTNYEIKEDEKEEKQPIKQQPVKQQWQIEIDERKKKNQQKKSQKNKQKN